MHCIPNGIVMLFLDCNKVMSVLTVESGPLEEPPPQRLPGADQEGGGEEEDREEDEGERGGERQAEEHQDLQRDCGGEVSTNILKYIKLIGLVATIRVSF